jgi:hypothetical protein
MFLIIISPAHRRGQRICGQFVASLDGRRLCISSEPLLAGARVLLAEGADPETRIAIRHTGTDSDALISTDGVAAALTVLEGNKAGPILVRWRAFSHDAVEAPMRQKRPPAPDPAPDTERIHDAEGVRA